MSYIISRFQYGITLNPKEYVLDKNGNLMSFITYEKAKEFILANGYEEEDIDECIYIEENEPEYST